MFGFRTARLICGVFAFVILLEYPVFAQQKPQEAPAQQRTLPPPVIAVIDFKRVITESKAGKSVVNQINQRHAQFQKEIQQITSQLEQSRQELSRQQSVLAPDVFAQKRQEFQKKAGDYQRTVQEAQKKLDIMLRQGMGTVENSLRQVVAQVAAQMGANIVIDAGLGRGDVLFTEASLVITNEALHRLNQVLPDVKVVEPVESAPQGQAPGAK
jgi:outer membrane protein